MAQIAASIAEFGWTNPVLITSSGQIIAGHGRVPAAQHLGLSQVPVLVLDHLTPASGLRLRRQQARPKCGWDDELVASELQALAGEGFDLDQTGFDANEVDELFDCASGGDSQETTGEDDTPEPEPTTVSRPGDIWLLGSRWQRTGPSCRGYPMRVTRTVPKMPLGGR